MPEPLHEPNGVNGASGSRHLNGTNGANGTNGLALRTRTQRKQSSPMMPAFIVSAPGKVIMFGEHAVVHGKVSFI